MIQDAGYWMRNEKTVRSMQLSVYSPVSRVDDHSRRYRVQDLVNLDLHSEIKYFAGVRIAECGLK
jgi:hypothetical protein